MKAIVQQGCGAPEQVLKPDNVDRPSVGDEVFESSRDNTLTNADEAVAHALDRGS